MKPFRGTGHVLPLLYIVLVAVSCENDPEPVPTSVQKWENLTVASRNEVPAPPGRSEEGTLNLELLSDNSLKYDFHIHNLTPGDVLTSAHLHVGDAGTSGPVYINLAPAIAGAEGTGTVTGLTVAQIDSIRTQPIYFNVHSTQLPAGIARVQLDKTVELAMDIVLNGTNENPDVITTATGLAILRMTSDKVLYSQVTVNNIESADTIRVSHIHRGGVSSNGPVRLFLCNNISEFGVMRTIPLVDSIYNMIKNDSVYVNAHSKLKGSGLVRGQIR